MLDERARRRQLTEKEESMNRLHVHVGVSDLDRSIRLYSALFDAEPAVVN